MLGQLLCGPRQRLEAAGADHEPPVGPGIPDPDYVDLHRSRASFCGDLGHDRNADAGGDQLADRIEIVQTRTKAQTGADARGVSADEIARQTTENFFRLFNKVPRTLANAA